MKKKEKTFNRYSVFVVVMLLIFAAIIARLIFLQVFQGEEFKEKANKRSITEVQDFAPRGNVLDVKGTVLATNKLSYMLLFTDVGTEESKKNFFSNMEAVFRILDENGESQKDDFEIKIDPQNKENPLIFAFAAEDSNVRRLLEIRFKKDRGLDEDVIKKLFPKKKDKLTEEQQKQVDDELLKITPEVVFKKLMKQYGIDKLTDKPYSLEQQRRFMLVKDAIKMQSFSGYKPVVIASNIKQETAFTFLQRLNELPGIDITTQPMRNYVYGELGSAFLGYISKIRTDQDKYEEKGYDISSDYVGAAGIEQVYEDNLKGTKGGRIVKINKDGRIVEELGKREPYPGQNIQLTINKDVQDAAEKSLDDTMEELRKNYIHSDGVNTSNATRGAAVVLNVKTGAVIALASRPGYNPSIFASPGRLTPELRKTLFNPDYQAFGQAKGFSQDKIEELFPLDSSIPDNKTIRKDDRDLYPKPLYNYATSSLIPPGSTFKALTAAAGLEEKVIDANSIIVDEGVYTKNNFGGQCWIYREQHSTHGPVNVAKALEQSCNYFFYEVGDRLVNKGKEAEGNKKADDRGKDMLAKYAWKFGLGKDPKGNAKPATGIEIQENFGQMSNLESLRQSIPNMILIDLVKELNDSKGIDISKNKDDSEEINGLKDKLKNTIKEQMKYKNTDMGVFSKQIVEGLKDFVAKAPALKETKFSNGDINTAVQIINRHVNNAYTQIVTPANIYNASIGQGTSQFTPVQLANYIATLVNGGNRYKVHLVDKFLDSTGAVIKEVKPEIIDTVSLQPETVKAIKEGMLKVTEGDSGTASSIFDKFPIITAGKTGSATFSDKQEEFGRTSYGLYVGFAPYDDPEIAVCVVIFDGAHGGFVAPVAKAIYESYFKDELAKLNYTPTTNYVAQPQPQQ